MCTNALRHRKQNKYKYSSTPLDYYTNNFIQNAILSIYFLKSDNMDTKRSATIQY